MQARAVKGYPLSIHQERLWQQGSQGLWRVVVQLQGEGVLFPERLEAAVQQVLQRHTILRTVFEEVPGLQLPVQVVLPEQQAVVWVQQIDLIGLPVSIQRERIAALQQQERHSALSGTREPLLRLLVRHAHLRQAERLLRRHPPKPGLRRRPTDLRGHRLLHQHARISCGR